MPLPIEKQKENALHTAKKKTKPAKRLWLTNLDYILNGELLEWG